MAGGILLERQPRAEVAFLAPGVHLHYDQEEWFYVMRGEVLIEIGGETARLRAGDSVFAPRKVPHVWAYVGERPAGMLVGFSPAGKMEAFFRAVTGVEHIPQDAKLLRDHGMELLGPQLLEK